MLKIIFNSLIGPPSPPKQKEFSPSKYPAVEAWFGDGQALLRDVLIALTLTAPEGLSQDVAEIMYLVLEACGPELLISTLLSDGTFPVPDTPIEVRQKLANQITDLCATRKNPRYQILVACERYAKQCRAVRRGGF